MIIQQYCTSSHNVTFTVVQPALLNKHFHPYDDRLMYQLDIKYFVSYNFFNSHFSIFNQQIVLTINLWRLETTILTSRDAKLFISLVFITSAFMLTLMEFFPWHFWVSRALERKKHSFAARQPSSPRDNHYWVKQVHFKRSDRRVVNLNNTRYQRNSCATCMANSKHDSSAEGKTRTWFRACFILSYCTRNT